MRIILFLNSAIACLVVVLSLIISIITKKRQTLRNVKIINIISLIYSLLTTAICFIPNLQIGLEILLFLIADVAALIIVCITMIISRIKYNRLEDTDIYISRKLWFYIIPFILLILSFAIECIALNSANLIIVENGGFLEPEKVYAITDKYCIPTILPHQWRIESSRHDIYYSYEYDDQNSLTVYNKEACPNKEITEQQWDIARKIAKNTESIPKNNNSVSNVNVFILGKDYYLAIYTVQKDTYYKYFSAVFYNDKHIANASIKSPNLVLFY